MRSTRRRWRPQGPLGTLLLASLLLLPAAGEASAESETTADPTLASPGADDLEPTPAGDLELTPDADLDLTPDADLDLDLDFDLEGPEPGYPDPLEGVNRRTFGFNEGVDHYLISPLTTGYEWVMPDPAEHAVRRVFQNFSEPVSAINHLLQLHPRPAGSTVARFVVNSTAGVGGIFDVARRIGLPMKHSDFGATLARYGTPSGPYLVIPLLGPTTVRDSVGDLVDQLVTPLGFLQLGLATRLVIDTGAGLSHRAEVATQLDAMRRFAVDLYAVIRTAYYMDRERELGGGQLDSGAALDSSADTSASKPSRLSFEVYSERRSAISETVPFR